VSPRCWSLAAAEAPTPTLTEARPGSSAGPRGTLVEDDFSNPASGWSTDNNDQVLLAYADGGYRILMKTPGLRDARLSFGSGDEPRDVQAVSVEADVTERAGPYTSGQPDEYEFHGVACWGAGVDSDRLEFGYKFVLSPEGHYGILKDDESGDGVILAEGDSEFDGYGATTPSAASALRVMVAQRRSSSTSTERGSPRRATPTDRIASRRSA
jgi:hypothetical protein